MGEEKWREKELSLEEVYEKYPDIPKLIILKTDVQRRGYILTKKAMDRFAKGDYEGYSDNIFYRADVKEIPVGIIFRDGTSVCGGYGANGKERTPYVIDEIDGKFWLTDREKKLEEIDFWKKPDFYDKKTRKGTPMKDVVNVRPQRLDFSISRTCHFWDHPGEGCKYCSVGINGIQAAKEKIPPLYDFEDIAEAVAEAIKQEGRYTMIMVTTGSILSGKKLFDDEVDAIIRAFDKVRPVFNTNQIKVQLIASAYDKEQQKRLKDATGIISYTPDIEVLNKELFPWICPGKAKYVGYDEWKKRIFEAVDVFGEGNVNTGFVGGVETAQPLGFQSEEAALEAVLKEAEDFARHGVSPTYIVWGIGGIFKDQVPPSLDYYIGLAKGLDQINREYGLKAYFDDYRHCGNHPSTDLSRIW